MKKPIPFLFCLVLGFAVVLNGTPVLAADATPTPETPPQRMTLPTALPTPAPAPDAKDVLSFPQIYAVQDATTDTRLHGPVDTRLLSFSLPEQWTLLPGARLELRGTSVISSLVPSQGSLNFDNVVAGTLNVILNDVRLHSEVLTGNSQFTLTIPLPETFLQPDNEGKYELILEWEALSSCTSNVATSVSVDERSRFVLPHELKPLSVDLNRFPEPFFSAGTLFPEAVILIVPDQPSAAELQSALSVVAGFSRLSAGKQVINLINVSALDEKTRADSHLIFVGKEEAFPALASDLETVFSVPPISDSSIGFIQAAVSPWNPERAILKISGVGADALIKGGQAVSSGRLIPLAETNTALVRDVYAEAHDQAFVEDKTFSDLGKGEITMTRFGSNKMLIPFHVPAGKSIGSEAYLDLVYNHSQMLDYLRSGIVVRLNQVPIGSARFSDSTAGLSTLRALVPSTVLRSGMNLLEIQADIYARDICADPRLENLWITIFPNSLLHLPEVSKTISTTPALSLSDYTLPFASNATLSSTAFVLPGDAPYAWQTAAQIAHNLGTQVSGGISAPLVILSAEVDATILYEKNVIFIGRPSSLPILTQFQNVLPAIFDSQDALTPETRLQVSFQIPTNAPLGYLEIGQSQENAVLAVLGNSQEGVQMAAQTLFTPRASVKLNGSNFAILHKRNVYATQLQAIVAEGETAQDGAGAPAGAAAPAAHGTTEELPPGYDQPETWILPGMAVSIVFMLLIIGMQIRNLLNKRKA